VFIVGGAIVAYLGWIGLSDRLTRNAVVGIRTRATMRSDEAWRAAHRTAGVWFVTAGVITTVTGMSMLVVGGDAAAWGVMRIGASPRSRSLSPVPRWVTAPPSEPDDVAGPQTLHTASEAFSASPRLSQSG